MFSFDEFLLRPLKVQFLLVAGLALLLQVPALLYITLPKSSNMTELESSVWKIQRKNKVLEEQIDANQVNEKMLTAVQSQLREKQEKLVTETDAALLPAILSQLAVDNALNIESISGTKMQDADSRKVLLVELNLSGRYHSITSFTRIVAGLPQMIVAEKLYLRSVEKLTARLSAEIHIRVYIREESADD